MITNVKEIYVYDDFGFKNINTHEDVCKNV